jgi:hypothetical protein
VYCALNTGYYIGPRIGPYNISVHLNTCDNLCDVPMILNLVYSSTAVAIAHWPFSKSFVDLGGKVLEIRTLWVTCIHVSITQIIIQTIMVGVCRVCIAYIAHVALCIYDDEVRFFVSKLLLQLLRQLFIFPPWIKDGVINIYLYQFPVAQVYSRIRCAHCLLPPCKFTKFSKSECESRFK